MDDGFKYTLMTDQQKGLKLTIERCLLRAEHRCCARHIYANWRKLHPGNSLQDLFWKASKLGTVKEFDLVMNDIKVLSPSAYDDLIKIEPRYWSRAFFSTVTKCDMVENNISECLNSWILEARYKC